MKYFAMHNFLSCYYVYMQLLAPLIVTCKNFFTCKQTINAWKSNDQFTSYIGILKGIHTSISARKQETVFMIINNGCTTAYRK